MTAKSGSKTYRSTLRTKSGRELDEMIMDLIDSRMQGRALLREHPPASVTLEARELRRIERELDSLRRMRRLLFETEREARDSGSGGGLIADVFGDRGRR